MPTNLELKVRYPSVAKAVRIARHLGADENGLLHQVDTYYLLASQRLKLR